MPALDDHLGRAMQLVGDRWSLPVLAALDGGPLRYGELQARLDGIASNILAARLAALEAAGLVVAEPYTLRPPRMRYALSDEGRELAGAIAALSEWAARHAGPEGADRPRHALCETPLELRWYCPTCDAVVDPERDGEDAFTDPGGLVA